MPTSFARFMVKISGSVPVDLYSIKEGQFQTRHQEHGQVFGA